jgi:uncharacterized SAM-binding protein YcdF (DUF218 family)
MLGVQENTYEPEKQGGPLSDPKPVEPEGSKRGRSSLLKWFFLLVFLVYLLLSYSYAPILTAIGKYLFVSHPPQESELIVCLSGENVERGLATADAFKRGLAPRIFLAREEPPDGYDILRERGIPYPETIDLLSMALKRLGVPESAIIKSDLPSGSTWEEAELVKQLIGNRNYKSILLITSPTHSRRTYLTFRRIIGDKDCRILVMPSSYSKFRPEDWWHSRRYVKEVILEYQKLIHFSLKSFS